MTQFSLLIIFIGNTCDNRYKHLKCRTCKNPNERAINWYTSPSPDHSSKPDTECIPATQVVDYWYVGTYSFARCKISFCKKCLTPNTCEECKSYDNSLDLKVYVKNSIYSCIQCLASDSRFVNAQGHCEDCPAVEECAECDMNGCTKCKDRFNMMEGMRKCVDCKKEVASYLDTDKVCKKCLKDCVTCTLGNECIKCREGYGVLQGSANPQQCVECKFKLGYFLNEETGICTPCLENCERCRNPKECQKCKDGFHVEIGSKNPQKCVQCPRPFHFASKVDNKCHPCLKNCEKCETEITCSDCEGGFLKKGGARNPEECMVCSNTGYFIDPALPKICEPCIEHCETCDSKDKCQKCIQGTYPVKGAVPNVCSPCNGPSEYLEGENCIRCPEGCADCENASICKRCVVGKILLKGSNPSICITQCPIQEAKFVWIENGRTVCDDCLPGCALCQSRSKCYRCQSKKHYLQPDFVNCLEDCPDGYFTDKTLNQCLKCPYGCKEGFLNGYFSFFFL